MKVLVTGAAGQVGSALVAASIPGIEIIGLARGALDICDAQAVGDAVKHHGPDAVINAAAYTAVDRAESEVETAMAVNATAVGHLAEACAEHDARLLQLSTDFVFDGAADRPYRPDDATAPLSVYGRSKLAGETAALGQLGNHALVLRTAWVYAAAGKNFVNTMLRLMRERDELSVVDDQLGSPTWAQSIATTCLELLRHDVGGVFHWTDKGVTSWHGFALEIRDRALARGLLDKRVNVKPIPTAEYPTPATRPANSVLDCSATEELLGRAANDWTDNLDKMLGEQD